jgi:poly(A) polymerase
VIEFLDLPRALRAALLSAASQHPCALVGGAVRDLLLHHRHRDPWRGLPDLDLVVEGSASVWVDALRSDLPPGTRCRTREHGTFGTVELEIDLPQGPECSWLLDVASARRETYTEPGSNPTVVAGSLLDDLARRDFSVNAIALDLVSAQMLDPHGGQHDLERRQLRLLHEHSLSDDPTRLLRAARYAARLQFSLAPETQAQAQRVLQTWPWPWRHGDDPAAAPPALSTRLRMELQLLLEREPWQEGLAALQRWGGLVLLDPALQRAIPWRSLHWGQRLGVSPLLVLMAAADQPLALAARLQLPHRDQRCLQRWLELRHACPQPEVTADWPASRWCDWLEAAGHGTDAVALAIVMGLQPRRPLLRWLLRWRHVRSPISAGELMRREGLCPGPALGHRLRQLRAEQLDQQLP